MKKTLTFCLAMLLSVMMIGSMVFAEEAADAAPADAQETTEAVEAAQDEAQDDAAQDDAAQDDTAQDGAEEEAPAEEVSLEDLLGESEGISVEVPLSENGEMTLESYDVFEIPSNQVTVQDYEIDGMISNILAGYSTTETIEEGTVEEGDVVVIDFTGVLEGEEEPFEGGSAEGVNVTLGSGTFIPGFEEQIIGHEIGETFDIQVTFPEDYTEELAGKNATFTITIHSKTVTHEQELNDDFVKTFSAENMDTELNTVDELKEYIRNFLFENYLQTAIMNQLHEKVTVVSYPESQFQTMKEYAMGSLTDYVNLYAMQGMGEYTEDMLAKMSGYASAEDYTNDQAKSYMDTMMIADQVSKDLGIELTDDEVNEYLQQVLAQNGMGDSASIDDITAVYGQGWIEVNKYNLLLSKILKELENRAVVVESAMTYQEFMSAELDSEVKLDVYVQDHQKYEDGKVSVYAADQNGGYFIYGMECSEEDVEKLLPGTKIHVEGYKAEWSGEVEIADATFSFVEDGDTFIQEPVDVTAMLGTGELVNYMNQFVSFQGLTVAPSTDADGNESAFLYNWDGSGTEGDDLYFNVTVNDETYSFVVESNLKDADSEVYAAVKNLNIGDQIDAKGFLYWYEGPNPHITSINVK